MRSRNWSVRGERSWAGLASLGRNRRHRRDPASFAAAMVAKATAKSSLRERSDAASIRCWIASLRRNDWMINLKRPPQCTVCNPARFPKSPVLSRVAAGLRRFTAASGCTAVSPSLRPTICRARPFRILIPLPRHARHGGLARLPRHRSPAGCRHPLGGRRPGSGSASAMFRRCFLATGSIWGRPPWGNLVGMVRSVDLHAKPVFPFPAISPCLAGRERADGRMASCSAGRRSTSDNLYSFWVPRFPA